MAPVRSGRHIVKRIALPLLAIAAAGTYAWSQSDLTRPALSGPPAAAVSPSTLVGARSATLRGAVPASGDGSPPSATGDSPAMAASPLYIIDDRFAPAAKVTRASMTVAARSGYVDGTYTGPVVDAYYGLVQIQAIVQGGRLVSIRVLKYPSDRRTSVFINRQALPMLRDEVISAQRADVDIISGATLTSEAFIRSLGAALQKAR